MHCIFLRKRKKYIRKTLDSVSCFCYTIPENKVELQCVLTYAPFCAGVNTEITGFCRDFVLKSANCEVCALFVGFTL